MYNCYFDYKIKRASNGEELSRDGDIMFFLERLFNENVSKFCYRLVLCIKRKIKLSGEKCIDNVFGCENGSNEKDYVSVIHFKANALPSNSSELNSIDYSLFGQSNSSDFYSFKHSTRINQNSDSNKECYYLKYVLDIPEENISSVGMIGFSSSPQALPSIDNTYFYEIEFFRKHRIIYDIEKKGSKKLKVTIKDIPQVSGDIKFIVLGDTAPIYKFENNILDGFELEMKAGSASRTIEKEFELIEEQKSYTHFRLAIKTYSFGSEKERYLKNLPSKLFILYPEHAPDIKDKTDKVEKVNIGTSKKVCPFCAHHVSDDALADKHIRFCDGEVFSHKVLNKKGKNVKKALFCQRYKSDAKFPMMVPPFLLKKKSKNIMIGLSGAPGCGKSVFLSSLLKLQNGLSYDLSYLNAYTSFYSNKFELVDLFYLNPNSFDICELMSQNVDFTENDPSSLLYNDFKMNYLLEDGYFLKTDPFIRFHPFIFKSHQTSFIIKDYAGESLSDEAEGYDDPEDPKLMIDNSDAYIVLIKPNQARTDFRKTLDRILKNSSNEDKPVAIVLTKFDLFVQNNRDTLDPSMAVMVDDTYSLMNLRSYSGSLLEKNVERASEEVKAIIKDTIPAFPFEEADKFTNVKYFAISSLGGDYRTCQASLNDGVKLDSKTNAYANELGIYLSPYRIELPILWILQQTGIIM